MLLDERALAYFEMINVGLFWDDKRDGAIQNRIIWWILLVTISPFIDRQGLMATAELHSRKQGQTETVADYSKAMYQVFAQLHIPPGSQQAKYFFKGLRPKLQLLVGRQDPQDLDSAERSAIQMERVEHEAPDGRLDHITEMVSRVNRYKNS